MENNFDGVFKFTNASDEDFSVMWNSKEYTFPANSTCPLIIANESLENVQAIRKRFALKYAQREFNKSKEGKAIEKEASKHFVPATYNESVLESYVQQCLSPLPIASAKTKDIAKQKSEFIDNGTVVLGDKVSIGSLSSADGEFKGYTPPELGAMAG